MEYENHLIQSLNLSPKEAAALATRMSIEGADFSEWSLSRLDRLARSILRDVERSARDPLWYSVEYAESNPVIDLLTKTYLSWLAIEGLRGDLGADEMLFSEAQNLTKKQRDWLVAFIAIWEKSV